MRVRVTAAIRTPFFLGERERKIGCCQQNSISMGKRERGCCGGTTFPLGEGEIERERE